MKLINKNSKEIREHERYKRFSPFVSFLASEKNVHFPQSAVTLAEIKLGTYVHFVEIGHKNFGFIVNNDVAGFKTFLNSKRDMALRISCGAFVHLFKERLGLKKGRVSFFIQKTQTELAGCPVYEILTNKSREELSKDAKK